MKPREQQAFDTKQKIIDTARELISKKGYRNMGIRELCEQAGISTGAFYHHFSSKEDMAAYGFHLFDSDLDHIIAGCEGKAPAEAIRYLIDSRVEFIDRYMSGLVKEIISLALSGELQIPPDYNLRLRDALVKYVTLAMENRNTPAAQSPEELANLLLKLVNGSVLDWCLRDYSYSLKERINLDLDFVLSILT